MSEIMVKIKASAAGFKAACKEAVTQAEASAKKIKQEFDRAKHAASSVGGPVGGAGGKLFGAGGMGGMGLGAAGLGAATAVANLAVQAYQEYRDAAVQAAQAAQDAADAEEKRGQKLDVSIRANEQATAALDKYAGIGELTNVQNLEAVKLLDALNNSYGNLGITIDDVRNKTDAYIAAQQEMAARNKKQREDSVQNQIDSLKSAMRDTQKLREEADTMLGRIMNRGDKTREYDKQLDTMREKLHALLKQQKELRNSDPAGDIRKKADAERADEEAKKKKEAAEAEKKLAEEKANAEKKAAEERLRLEEKATREYERQMELLKLQRDGNTREAAIRKAEFQAEDQFGGSLTEEQRKTIRERAGNLFDAAQKDAAPVEKTIAAIESVKNPEITNSLQRIGALGGASAGIDYTKKTYKTTEDILAAVNKIAGKSSASSEQGMYF